jgi:hypothetical protein
MPQLKSRNIDNTWAELIREALQKKGDNLPPGEGWRTAKQLQKDTGRADAWVSRFIRDGKRDGKLEVFNGMVIPKGGGRPHRQTWYRPKA